MRERHVSELLAEVFRRGGMRRAVRRAEAVLLWRRLVGAELAAFSTALTLRDGILYVNVSDSETAMHLSLERHRFIAAYRDRYAVTDVRDIRFQVGRLEHEELPAEAPPTLPPPDEAAVRSMREELEGLELPQEVFDEALGAARNLISLREARRAEGWTPCPCCGVLHDGAVRPRTLREAALEASSRRDLEVELSRELCEACARYSREGRVVAASRALRSGKRSAGADLSEDEAAVARHLALRGLDDTLAALLPAAASEPRLSAQLEAVSRIRVALASDKAPEAVTREELGRLDPRIPVVLARGNKE